MSALAVVTEVGSPPVIGSWHNAVEWDGFVARSAAASFYHLAAWRDVLQEALGLKTWYRVARGGSGECVGVLPLAHAVGPLDHYLVSLPFVNAGGPLGSAAAQAALVDDALAEARATKATLLELRAPWSVAGALTPTPRKITVRLDLPTEPADLWERFPPKLRSQIRRAERAGFTVRHGVECWPDFYRVFARHMHELGTPALPKGWFGALADAFSDAAHVSAIYLGGVPVAAGFGFLWRGTMEIVWASSLKAHAAEAPNMLLYWSFLTQSIARGAREFDFGRCTAGSGTHRFKRQWGGRDVELPWLQWRAPGALHVGAPSTDAAPFRLAARVWRRLPYAVASVLGPVIVRWLP